MSVDGTRKSSLRKKKRLNRNRNRFVLGRVVTSINNGKRHGIGDSIANVIFLPFLFLFCSIFINTYSQKKKQEETRLLEENHVDQSKTSFQLVRRQKKKRRTFLFAFISPKDFQQKSFVN